MFEVVSVLSGYFLFHHILDFFGMYSFQEGVNYYSEVHQSLWNSVLHTLLMPFTVFGFFLAIPALFRMNNYEAHVLRKCVCLFYISHYLHIHRIITLMIVMFYTAPFIYAHYWYTYLHYYNKHIFLYGLSISIVSLFLQEFLGHYIGGDEPSRLNGIPNAIIYAPYYAISHFFQ